MKRHSMHRKQAIVQTRWIMEHAIRLTRCFNLRRMGFLDAKRQYEDEIAELHAERDEARHESKLSMSLADEVYAERNRLVAFLSKLLPASLERHEEDGWGPEWGWVCYIDSFVGQLSWHIKTSELYLFDHLERNTGVVWDGHSTEEKYKRIESYPAPVWSSSDPEAPSEIEQANAELEKLRAELEAIKGRRCETCIQNHYLYCMELNMEIQDSDTCPLYQSVVKSGKTCKTCGIGDVCTRATRLEDGSPSDAHGCREWEAKQETSDK